jgi:hypothetical protein
MDVARPRARREDPRLDDRNAARLQVTCEIGERGLQVVLARQVADRTEQARHDIELLAQLEGPHVAADEGNPGKAPSRDTQHLCIDVHPGALVPWPQER